jgi:hypothetical protein
MFIKKKHQKTFALIFARPANGSTKWKDIESLFCEPEGRQPSVSFG